MLRIIKQKEINMECKHQYFQYIKGGLELVCVQCGKPAHSPQIEDKMAERTEVKRIIPKGVSKVGRPKRK